jgi:ABC-type nickel/cobalt efflux system permease component RcnA
VEGTVLWAIFSLLFYALVHHTHSPLIFPPFLRLTHHRTAHAHTHAHARTHAHAHARTRTRTRTRTHI